MPTAVSKRMWWVIFNVFLTIKKCDCTITKLLAFLRVSSEESWPKRYWPQASTHSPLLPSPSRDTNYYISRTKSNGYEDGNNTQKVIKLHLVFLIALFSLCNGMKQYAERCPLSFIMHKADWDNGHLRDLRRGYQSHHLFISGSSLDRWQSKHCWSLDPADEWPLWSQSNHLQNMYIIQDIAPCPASFPTPVKEPSILSVIFHLGDREAHWSILELIMRWVPAFSCIEDTSRQHCGHLY